MIYLSTEHDLIVGRPRDNNILLECMGYKRSPLDKLWLYHIPNREYIILGDELFGFKRMVGLYKLTQEIIVDGMSWPANGKELISRDEIIKYFNLAINQRMLYNFHPETVAWMEKEIE